jgi:hypothetical protein
MTESPPEYQTPSIRPWAALLEAEKELDRVLAEYIPPQGKLGADLVDVDRATAIVHARALVAAVDALHGIRQQLTLVTSLMNHS